MRQPSEIAAQITLRKVHIKHLYDRRVYEVWADDRKQGQYFDEASAEHRLCELLGLTADERIAFLHAADEQLRIQLESKRRRVDVIGGLSVDTPASPLTTDNLRAAAAHMTQHPRGAGGSS